jgi:hypothetical protein
MAEEPKADLTPAYGEKSQAVIFAVDSDIDSHDSKQQLSQGTFDATEDHHFYRPIDSYEGIHRWDPEFKWSAEEEKKILRKVGYVLDLQWPCLTTSSPFID